MSTIAITNANVYNHETGEFSPKTVLVKEAKIQAVVPPDEPPHDWTIIDATGCYLTPGFIDACSQIGLKEIGVRWEGNDGYEPHEENMNGLQVIDGIYPFDQAFQDAVAFGVTAAHIVSSANSVTGAETAVIHTHGKTADEMIIRHKLGYSFSMGDVPKKAFWEKTHTPLTRMGVAHKIRSSIKELQKQEQLQETPIFIRCHRADDIATALRIAKEFGLQMILVHATDYSKISSHETKFDFSIIAGPCFQPIEREEQINLRSSLYRVLKEQHGQFAFTTDHPVSSVKHLQLEGCLAIKAGVSEQVVLNGLTQYGAKLLRIDHLTGTIQPGLFADLVLWNKHPLQLTARAVRTFIKGKEVYRWE
ncbi:amidohydrolase family protein [Pseudalkalibacillus decolorationis]|uniref:amidohydrolase family protein n=1 Tax=Pseudalkalibacillus decolorationis TaxID=163879 RepID=UPI002149264E|nr:amidohydrolase family protein [Pseudalkalibacillus decolorationis]